MSIDTKSVFYYDVVVDAGNLAIDLDDGTGVIQISLDTGSYTFTGLAQHAQSKLREFGNQDYVVTPNRDERNYTISAPLAFDLLFTSGPRSEQSAANLLGYSGSDKTGSSTYTGSLTVGSAYFPQFFLQQYKPTRLNRAKNRASINETAAGAVESVTFGDVRRMECNITYVNDNDFCQGFFDRDPNAVDNLVDFMEYLITKGPIEFMEDRDNRDSFEELLLERSPQSGDGTAFDLQELLPSLPGFYETGRLVFRRIEL